jgi:hypothetical protein
MNTIRGGLRNGEVYGAISYARAAAQRCGSNSSSCRIGHSPMRVSTSGNQANGSTFASGSLLRAKGAGS